MPVIERHTTIHATPEAVWAVLADVERQPRWMHDLRSVKVEGHGEVRVGARALGTVRMFGVTQQDPVVFTALDRPRRYAVRHLGGFTGTGEFRLLPVRGGAATRVRWREVLMPTGAAVPVPAFVRRFPGLEQAVRGLADRLLPLVDPLLEPIFALVFRADLRRLKRLVESRDR